MANAYTQEELWKLYDRLPKELQEAVFSAETAGHIASICERNNIADRSSSIASQVGPVLLGVLPPEELALTLQKEAGLEKQVAESVVREINRFIFQQIRPQLERLYQQTEEKHLDSGQNKQAQSKKTQRKAPLRQKKERTPAAERAPASSKDTYREPIEE